MRGEKSAGFPISVPLLLPKRTSYKFCYDFYLRFYIWHFKNIHPSSISVLHLLHICNCMIMFAYFVFAYSLVVRKSILRS